MIIDAHLHVFKSVNGRGPNGPIRSASHGRVCTRAGRARFLPPFFGETAFDIDMAVALLDEYGVDRAVLMQNAFIGTRNREIAAALERFPGRFVGAIQADPMSSGAVSSVERMAEHPGMKILKLELSEGWGWTGIYPGLRVDGPEIARLWDAAARKGLSVLVDPGPPLTRGYDVRALEGFAARYPETPVVIDHMGYLTRDSSASAKHLAQWRSLWKLARLDNVHLGLSAAAALLEDPYPCMELRRYVREIWEAVGPKKLLWGTDAPVTLNGYTYAQMLDVFRERMDFLPQADRNRILGGNALRLWWGK